MMALTLGFLILFGSPFAGIYVADKLGGGIAGMSFGAAIGLFIGYVISNVLVYVLLS